MSLIQINRDPSRGQLAVFGIIWLTFFGLIGGIVLIRSESFPAAGLLWAVAVLMPVIGWIVPAFMRMLYISMACVGYPIGFVLSHLVLAVLYYVVLTSTGWLLRLFRCDPMSRRFQAGAETYWLRRERGIERNRYFRQF